MNIDLLPLWTFGDDNPDLDQSDIARDTDEMMRRNDAVEDFVLGKISGDDLLGIIDESGIDADEYLDSVLDNIVFAMGKHYLPCNSGLLLPI